MRISGYFTVFSLQPDWTIQGMGRILKGESRRGSNTNMDKMIVL
jgi:hypothetical protein